MKTTRSLAQCLALSWLAILTLSGFAQGMPLGKPIHYELIDGSFLVEDCSVCGPPTVQRPMRGSFDLVLVAENPISAHYELRGIEFRAGSEPDLKTIKGSGSLVLSGEVAVRLTAVLEVTVNGRSMVLTNDVPTPARSFPMLAFDAREVTSSIFFVGLGIRAAPFREIWFSTGSGMTPGAPIPGFPRLTGAELLADPGRVVRPGSNLLESVGIEPQLSDRNMDMVCIAPGGEVWFSLDAAATSKTLGDVQEGDVLSTEGNLVWRNQALTQAFGLMPLVPDLGLDALSEAPGGEILFSIRRPAFSERLGVGLGDGDLLSVEGVIYRGHADLVARFEPEDTKTDHGLDAVHVWPNGEIWFSTSLGFYSRTLGPIGHGDLLSDAGYIVRRNLDLVSPFMPLEDLSDFGLDGLFLVTDLIPESPPPQLLGLSRVPGFSGARVGWKGQGRVFQLERSPSVGGPYTPWSPLTPDSSWNDPQATPSSAAAFYRVRQW